ncbi:LysR family transcriptional regulator [Vibrio sp. 10N.286.49.C2]|uniref:LysR family transcriptional regulator n=1 Tax=unclassified Vibrio TaxID=2614977 RepID=UPI000C819491|nr:MULTISPECIES: LysR family transcriptional regulator [unclassified Vibrio]PMH26370.1 LysR family transcriptional regulator [Vibrio sp. 10N.286.49.C2]PMH54906.1 LysR family transcriptional regulator [Vibrio sp. 10N.286.49.B1]PMH81142.1 LysR family transcriptional regulator [Vibrio sp. 10N.286.48.B7]
MNNYKLLRPLLVLLETRSLTLAASRLNVTQSAMSRTLSQIRTAFNDPILIREGKQFVISAKGERLLEQLPMLLKSIDDLYHPSEFVPSDCSRRFSLAYTGFFSESIVPLICSTIMDSAPEASFHSELWQTQNLTMLHEGDVDILATTLDQFPENVHGKKLIEDDYVVIMSKDHPLAHADLTQDIYFLAKHVLVHGMKEMRQYVSEQFDLHEQERRVLAKTPSFLSACELVVQSQAFATAPLHIAGSLAQSHSIVVKTLPLPQPKHHYYLLWHSKYQSDPAHRWFRDQCFMLLQQHLKQTQQLGKELIKLD